MRASDDPYPVSKVSADDKAMELHVGVARLVADYVQAEYGSECLEEVLRQSRVSLEYLRNISNWVSFECYCRLLDVAVEVTGDRELPFKAGQVCSCNKSFWLLEHLLRHLGRPGTAYRFIARWHRLWTKIATIELVQYQPNRCVLRFKYPNHKQTKNNCLAVQGCLASGPALFGLPFADCREIVCSCEGNDACVYEVTWTNRFSHSPWGAICGTLGFAVGAALALEFRDAPAPLLGCALAAVTATGFFVGRTIEGKQDLAENQRLRAAQEQSLQESLADHEALNRELESKVKQRTRELSTANARLKDAMKELEESQARALRRERQAAVGVLAGGMAHEMNNPINAIQLSHQALREDLADRPEVLRILATAERGSTRCKRIVNELLSFSRNPQKILPADLRDIVTHTLEIFKEEAPDGVTITSKIAATMPKLALDHAQMQQGILNLLQNAADAMKGSGHIDVELKLEGDEAVLTVSDDGPGMDEQTIEQVFDPFFSTKAGTGLGLGLSITCQLVDRNGGTIDVTSRKGEGTTFTIRFPTKEGSKRAPQEEG